tara:strand:+ start:340 stop:1131 length:792 start_codon:yes stop_codon:yes gene_type:complete
MDKREDSGISLYEFFLVLWAGRKIISIFTVSALFIGLIYLTVKTPSYESRIFYKIDILPPSVDTDLTAGNVRMLIENIRLDYESLFYEKYLFNKWKKDNSNSSLTFDVLSSVEQIDGFDLSKKPEDKLISFVPSRKGIDYHINVKTSDLSFLNDLYNYANYINDNLTQRYLESTRKEQKFIENLSSEQKMSDYSFKISVTMGKFISSIEDGERLLNVSPPTIPEEISPIYRLVIIFSLFAGFFLGCFYVHIKNSIKGINMTKQ